MAAVLSGLEPRACWRHFEALTRIARPSRQEEAVIEHVRAWAAGNDFELREDGARNLVVRVPPSAVRESAPPTLKAANECSAANAHEPREANFVTRRHWTRALVLLTPEPRLAPDAETPLHLAVLSPVANRCPDEHEADDHDRYREQHDDDDLGKRVHASSLEYHARVKENRAIAGPLPSLNAAHA
jgi:hypothetical protein